MKSKNIWTIIIAVIFIAGMFFLLLNTFLSIKEKIFEKTEAGTMALWKNIELKDVKTGEIFKISEFEGKPILLESFAVWCSVCTKQQEEISKLHEEIGDTVISISIDTDPNEDESKILNHIDKNGFDWYYAISPAEMTKSLIDEFGNGIINAPSAPMILICEDGSYRKLGGTGSRKVNELKEEIKAGC